MAYLKSEMLFNDGKYYKWTAAADHDNPYYTKGTDYSEINRTEGFEVLYFINHFANKNSTASVSTATYNKIERGLRYSVPANIKTHKKVADWLLAHWGNF